MMQEYSDIFRVYWPSIIISSPFEDVDDVSASDGSPSRPKIGDPLAGLCAARRCNTKNSIDVTINAFP